MKLQPESKKELTRIACGTAICTAVMWVIFAALHLVGWVKFDYTVVLGSLIGAAVAIGNFAGICLVCQKVIDEQDEKRRKATLQASYNVRMLLQAVWIIVAIGAPVFQPHIHSLVLHLPGRQKRTKRLLLISKGVHHYAAGGNQHKTDDSNRGEFFLVCKNRNQRGDNQSNAAPGCVSDIQVDPVQTFCKGVMADNIRRRANQRRDQLCKALRLLQIACGDNLRDNCNGKKCIFHFASQSFLF